MRVLVTGASGYVGHAVVRALHTTGHDVRALPGDLLDGDAVGAAVSDVDGVIHLAARSNVRESFERPDVYYRTNVTGTLTLLDRLAPGTRLVLASTASVYGAPPTQPITESTALNPQNPYAATKAAAEAALGWYAPARRLAAATLRIFNVAGAVDGHGDPDGTRILPRAVSAAAGKLSHVDVYGDGSAVRDFVHVADVANAFTLALAAVQPGRHRAYNVGAIPATIADIIATTERVTARPVPVVHHDRHPHEVPDLRADTTLIRRELGWGPTHTTLDGLIADQWRSELTSPRGLAQ
ncbi:MAG TPA: NAD-dependent epimerase/dehydratase family protein [Actinophytocola sp.]|uniref:NAD-dependent epimerase/dehydratase family protein n=1 Tax=Actinophytocola sp. TaxID=1872138 RepID=UPI002DDCD116|nr:NAD-dependent epimerase/dehydratase family protein [Actinophytocola sp.]HEV2783741.1 NAD-dependent epimerase/dehydratase family protein [Actinophytocola sp.]